MTTASDASRCGGPDRLGDITLLLSRACEGDKESLDAIFELLHPELRKIARRRLARQQRDGAMARMSASATSCRTHYERSAMGLR